MELKYTHKWLIFRSSSYGFQMEENQELNSAGNHQFAFNANAAVFLVYQVYWWTKLKLS